MSQIKLSNGTIEIVDRITWGQQEAIRAAMLSGAKVEAGKKEMEFNAGDSILAGKYKTIEVCVVKITEGEKEIPFSREWLDNLSPEDGDALFAAVDAVANPAKKA